MCVCVCVCVFVIFCVNVCYREATILKNITYIESNISSQTAQVPFFSSLNMTFILNVKL